jgi:hypothetical protein
LQERSQGCRAIANDLGIRSLNAASVLHKKRLQLPAEQTQWSLSGFAKLIHNFGGLLVQSIGSIKERNPSSSIYKDSIQGSISRFGVPCK